MTPAGYYCLCNGDMDLSFTSIRVISSLTSSFITRILVNKLSSVPLQFSYTLNSLISMPGNGRRFSYSCSRLFRLVKTSLGKR